MSDNDGNDNDNPIRNMFGAMADMAKQAEKDREKRLHARDRATVAVAKQYGAVYLTRERLRVGDVVVWKEGMKNVPYPVYDEPMVVLELRRKRTMNCNCEGICLHKDIPSNVRVSISTSEGDFESMWLDIGRLHRIGTVYSPRHSWFGRLRSLAARQVRWCRAVARGWLGRKRDDE